MNKIATLKTVHNGFTDAAEVSGRFSLERHI